MLSVDSPDIQRLIETHTPVVAERLGRLRSLLTEFYNEICGKTTLRKNEVPIQPVTIYPPELRNAKGLSSEVVRLGEPMDHASGREVAAQAYAQIEYIDDQAPNLSIKCYGAIGVPMRLIHVAKSINQAKDELRAAIAPVSKKRVKLGAKNDSGDQGEIDRELTTVVLRRIQESQVGLLAAYRHIPIVDEPVNAIRLTYINTRSVARRTVQSIVDQLSNDGHPSTKALADLTRLSTLDPNEFLVRPGNYYRRMRAKVFLERTATNESGVREQVVLVIPADLPILFPMTSKSARPIMEKPEFSNERRTISRIEGSEFVTSLRFHRMRPEFRKFAKKERQR